MVLVFIELAVYARGGTKVYSIDSAEAELERSGGKLYRYML